ncbi:MAG: hypothetical protein K2K63_12715 [Acetatifactor sp.]|nr:hypothetical protein [Acetatifactor sp.]
MGRSERENDIETMKEMIQKEIQSIVGLEERVAFKELMEGVFLSLYDTNLKMYEELERRVKEELDYDKNRYHIKTGIIEREFFDESHHLLFPMEERDLAGNLYDMKEILRAVTEEGAFPLMKVMLRCDYLELQRLLEAKPVFEGVIETEEPAQEWKVEVRLRENREYLEKIAYLYLLFTRNGIPWQTVNAPYLYKMADMIVTGLPEGITGGEKIKQVTIQFGEYSKIIQKDVIPVWNIQKLALDSVGFPTPCEDHRNFEHNISLRQQGTEHAYLVENDRNIHSISQSGERLKIVCETGEAKKWSIYQIRSSAEQRIDRYTFPIMGNGREESFSEKYQRKWNQHIRTKTELVHFIRGLGLEDYVSYEDCRVEDGFPGRRENYSMNFFVQDEIRDKTAQKKLILYFRPGQKLDWLQRDILSFLVSEVQRIYPEYDCGGVLL